MTQKLVKVRAIIKDGAFSGEKHWEIKAASGTFYGVAPTDYCSNGFVNAVELERDGGGVIISVPVYQGQTANLCVPAGDVLPRGARTTCVGCPHLREGRPLKTCDHPELASYKASARLKRLPPKLHTPRWCPLLGGTQRGDESREDRLLEIKRAWGDRLLFHAATEDLVAQDVAWLIAEVDSLRARLEKDRK